MDKKESIIKYRLSWMIFK